MGYYELVKITIDALGLVGVILDVVVWHHDFSNTIIYDKGLLFTLKFWSSLCYFLDIKQKLSTAFYPHINGQIKGQNSTMEAHLQAFINFKQNNWVRPLPMTECL